MAKYIGLMSGTSMDGVDAVLCDITETSCTTLSAHTIPYSSELLHALNDLCSEGPDELNTLSIADRLVAETFSEVTLALLDKNNLKASDITAIGSHGQTVRHYPNSDVMSAHFSSPSIRGFTCQIGDPNTIAVLTGIDVVADFRRKDIALGGQGAPLVPAFHNAAFASKNKYRALVNIGGIANISLLAPKRNSTPPKGFDTGPGNTLMDQWISLHLNESFDKDGAWAASGQCHSGLLGRLLLDNYFALPPPKSTGREHFNIDWLSNALADYFPSSADLQSDEENNNLAPEDVQATLLTLTGSTIAQEIKNHLPKASDAKLQSEVIVCGGGAFNKALMAYLNNALSDYAVADSYALGIHPQQVEGSAFAWLAHAFINDIPSNVPKVTGASRSTVLGALFKKA
ncbi:anhydro-N-acetylmuramic acid kinase [Alteromonas sp. BL110]|uniref:anhydro-N-acetylmuramic acid kinase n=1 Tax=Alteromonas sp. BL110 TaxID=1714845 RepID=UPI000E48AA4E|nr:anhydro-N-acetylmuramic acid kinase [Alteromonas sp. BL110]AXT39349.1 anhydro-N-acetylmuramic acid kinase [Alteromonas sp. BL110]RKM82166.1 anhydro-N-acetylmuramic acid kinase [Alteromonas sp. BL110]